jgi:hypothetical protein
MRTKHLLFLLCVLIGANLLVYVNAPTDADGMAMLAVAANLTQHGSLDINIIGANDWLLLPRGKMGTFGIDGALYAKKGITPSLALIPLVALANWLPMLTVRATAALLNSFVTMATALLLYSFLGWLGYRSRTALALALLFGLATVAITYVKTLFGEPLVALLLLAAVMAAWRWRERGGAGWLLSLGAALALIIGVNLVYAVFVLLFALYVGAGTRQRFKSLLLLVVPIALMVAIIAAQNWGRFGNVLTSGYQFAAGEGFTYPLLDGLYGLILSPYRGYFWYNPLLILALPGWVLLRRKQGSLAWLIAALCLVQPLIFASWWSWYGGIVWGPRFLLPTVPLALVCLAPVMEQAWSRRWWFVGIGVLGLLSALLQALGVLLSYLPYTGYLIAAFSEPIPRWVIADPLLCPVVGHLALLWGRYPLDPAWLIGEGGGVDWAHLVGCMALIVTGIGLLALRTDGRVRRRLTVGITTVGVCFVCGLVVTRQDDDPSVVRIRALEAVLTPPARTLVASTLFGDSLIDLAHGAPVITMNAPTAPDDPRARAVWEATLRQGGRLWLVTWFPPAAPENWQERDLWATASFIQTASAAEHRAVLFDLRPAPTPDREVGAVFGATLRLARIGTRPDADGVAVTLEWAAQRTVTQEVGWFVHVIDASGVILVQQDRQPQGGYRPTTSWRPDEAITDRLYFLFPPSADPQQLRLRIGMVDVATGQPLFVTQNGERAPDPFVIVPLLVPDK